MRTGEENCLGRYSRRFSNQNGEHLINPYESNILGLQVTAISYKMIADLN